MALPPGPWGGDPLGGVWPGDTGVHSRAARWAPATSSCSDWFLWSLLTKRGRTPNGAGFQKTLETAVEVEICSVAASVEPPSPGIRPTAIMDTAWPPPPALPPALAGARPVSSLAHLGSVNLPGEAPLGLRGRGPALPWGKAEAARDRGRRAAPRPAVGSLAWPWERGAQRGAREHPSSRAGGVAEAAAPGPQPRGQPSSRLRQHDRQVHGGPRRSWRPRGRRAPHPAGPAAAAMVVLLRTGSRPLLVPLGPRVRPCGRWVSEDEFEGERGSLLHPKLIGLVS